MGLSEKQEKIKIGEGCFVVKACPGSGKTYSVSARIAYLLENPNNDFNFKGIAAVSFTNVASDEIQAKLKNDFGVSIPLKFPHFIGTIDSFVNKYILLPYGHLIMKCNQRPLLVGEPYSQWTVKKYDRDPDYFFDKTTFDKNGTLVKNADNRLFNFKWFKKNGEISGHVKNIENSKCKYFKQGFVNQSDSNYIAYRILSDYKNIVKNIINRFSYFIIDEAQDTTDVQMGIIEKLIEQGAKEMVLIGDPDQAVFEWNDAKPEQFLDKYREWEQSKEFDLFENRRSSKLICDCTRNLLSIPEYDIIGDCKDYDFKPVIIGHNKEKANLETIRNEFLKTCYERQIDKINKYGNYNIAILYRSHSIGNWLGILNPEKIDTPWKNGHYHVRDIAQGKYLWENGELRKGFKMLERGYHKLMGNFNNVTNEYIRNEITKHGFKEYRNKLFYFVDLLPTTLTQDLKLKDWKNEANGKLSNIGKKLEIDDYKADISFDELFQNSKERKHPDYFIGTIHSAKGKTFEAVLVVLDKKFGNKRNYINIIKHEYCKLAKATEKEEIRTAYVAMTRPKKILMISVPEEDCNEWKKKLGL